MFKMCLKKLFKKLCKLLLMKSKDQNNVVFLPELVSDEAMRRLDQILVKPHENVQVLSLFSCPKVLNSLSKIEDERYNKLAFYSLGFNDQFLAKDCYLQILNNLEHFDFCVELFRKVSNKMNLKITMQEENKSTLDIKINLNSNKNEAENN